MSKFQQGFSKFQGRPGRTLVVLLFLGDEASVLNELIPCQRFEHTLVTRLQQVEQSSRAAARGVGSGREVLTRIELHRAERPSRDRVEREDEWVELPIIPQHLSHLLDFVRYAIAVEVLLGIVVELGNVPGVGRERER